MIKNKNIEKKPKIALVCYTLSVGGLGRVVSNASFMFSEMGFEVDIHVLRSEADYPFEGHLHQYNIDKHSRFGKIRQYLKLKKSIKENHYDLIIDHRYRLNPVLEFFVQRFAYAKQKVINNIHSSFIQKYLFSNTIINQFIFKKRIFICVSKGIEKKVNSKFPKLKTKTIYNIVSFEDYDYQEITENNFILTITRMDESNVKQIDVLLECFAKSELPEKAYKLIIIGSGIRKEQMENLAVKLKISDKVVFKGFLTNPYSYLRQADFTVLTSKHEGLPTLLIESLMSGIPVVSFDCETGPNEIIINEENGLLVENQNKEAFVKAINRMIDDKNLYQKLKFAAKKSAEKFSKTEIKKEWERFVGELEVSEFEG